MRAGARLVAHAVSDEDRFTTREILLTVDDLFGRRVRGGLGGLEGHEGGLDGHRVAHRAVQLDHGAFVGFEELFQPPHAFGVEMVGRVVEQQHIRARQQQAGEGDSALFTAR